MPKTYDCDPYLKYTKSLDHSGVRRERSYDTCEYYIRDDGAWACDNESGEFYGLITHYNSGCDEWEVQK